MEEHISDQIKRYARGQMSASEHTAFEKRLETDAAFAAEFSAWAAIYKGIQAEGDAQLERQLHELGKKLLQNEAAEPAANTARAVRFSLPRWAYAVAAALLLLLLAWPVYRSLLPSRPAYAGNRALFEKHFHPLPPPEVRDAGDLAWKEAYRQKIYPEAIAELEKLLADPAYAAPSEARLYLGLSYLEGGQGRKAIETLEQVSRDSYDHDDAQWYSALAYIIIDDVVHAKQVLEEIAGSPVNPHRLEAQEMLKEMQ